MSPSPPDQHSFLVEVLCHAGGVDVESLLPPADREKRADVVFREHGVIVEVKELTTDRSSDPGVAEALGTLITSQAAEHGGPVIFGEVSVRLDKLPDKVARNSMRYLTKRIQREVGRANRQIADTKAALEMPQALGLLVFVAPPMKTNLRVIGWAVHDAMRGGKNSNINSLMLVETRIERDGQRGDSVLSFHSRDGIEIPVALKRRIAEAWGKLTGHSRNDLDEDAFFRRYP